MTSSAFFDGIRPTRVRVMGREFDFPFFIYEGRAMNANFPAHFGRLRRLLPDPRLVPARIAPGVGIVSLSAFEYRRSDIGPYNEVAICIPLNDPAWRLNLPGRAFLGQVRRRQFSAYIHHLPVTTEIACETGLWAGFPKFMSDIDFTEETGARSCSLVQDGQHILTLRGPDLRTRRTEQFGAMAYVMMDRQVQSMEFRMNAVALGERVLKTGASLELSDNHPVARELRGLLLSDRPLHYRYVSQLEAIEYAPDRVTPFLMQKFDEVRQVGSENGAPRTSKLTATK